MTRKALLTLTVLVTVFGLGAVFASPASADEQTDAYRAAMADLVPLTQDWAREMRTEMRAVTIKPELACTAEFGEIINHGVWLAADLEGSAMSAPAEIADVNLAAAAGLWGMVDGARTVGESCDGSRLAKGTAEMSNGYDEFRPNATRLQLWLDGPDAIGAVQPIPVLPTF